MSFLGEHKHEIITAAIGIAISFAVGFILTGDVTAHTRGR